MTDLQPHSEPTLGIYVHWPFCVRRCSYCSFVSSTDFGRQEPYYRTLLREIEACGRLYAGLVDSVFIGGGTPSTAPSGAIDGLITALREAFRFSGNAEITIEANPDSIAGEPIAEWREAGVNRLSIGLQSTHAGHLFQLGRVHTLSDFEHAYRLARDAFSNINIDLMYGLPYQTIGEWKQTLRYVRSLKPEHVSCYALSLEEGTQMRKRVLDGAVQAPNDALEAKMYARADTMLRQAGYEHYEISNFARPGHICRHNLKYWSLDDYLGLGAGAHSMIGLFRFANADSVIRYIEDHEQHPMKYEGFEFITPQERENEFVMLKTRLRQGFTEDEYKDVFGHGFREMHGGGLERCVEEGLLEVRDGRIQPTQQGFLFQNRLAVHLMMP